MVATVDQVKAWIGQESPDYDDMLADMLAEATELIDHYLGSATVPTVVHEQAEVVVAADLWNRRAAPNGVIQAQFPGFEGGETVRIARDPMRPAYPILRRWVPPWRAPS